MSLLTRSPGPALPRTSEPMRRSSRRQEAREPHGGAVNIAGSVIAGVDQVAGHQELGRRAPHRFEFGALRRSPARSTIVSLAKAGQPSVPCLRLFARFHEGRTAYRNSRAAAAGTPVCRRSNSAQ